VGSPSIHVQRVSSGDGDTSNPESGGEGGRGVAKEHMGRYIGTQTHEYVELAAGFVALTRRDQEAISRS